MYCEQRLNKWVISQFPEAKMAMRDGGIEMDESLKEE
jgi:hypothetical protein